MQKWIVLIVVGLSAVYLLRSFCRYFKKAKQGGCSMCGSKDKED